MPISYKLSDQSKELLADVREIILKHGMAFFPGIQEAMRENDHSLANNVLLEGCLREFPTYLKWTVESRARAREEAIRQHAIEKANAKPSKRPRYPGYIRDVVAAIEFDLWDRRGLRQERDQFPRADRKELTAELLSIVAANEGSPLSVTASKITAWLKTHFAATASISSDVWEEMEASLVRAMRFPYRGWLLLDDSYQEIEASASADSLQAKEHQRVVSIRSQIPLVNLQHLIAHKDSFWKGFWTDK